MSDELDPEIAALLSDSHENKNNQEISIDIEEFNSDKPLNSKSNVSQIAQSRYGKPGVHNPFGDNSRKLSESAGPGSIHTVDLSKNGFEPITKLISDTPFDYFSDPAYYKVALSGENQSAQRVHQLLTKYLTTKDQKDRAVFRQQIITAFWEFLRGLAGRMADKNLAMPKRMLFRFGVILPSLFRPEQKEFFSKVFFENKTGEPVLYMDEWFKEISTGRMQNSATDEKRTPKRNMTAEEASNAELSRLNQLQSKNSGKLQSSENLLNIKENERRMIESEIQDRLNQLFDHVSLMGLEPHTAGLSEFQRKLLPEIIDLMHRFSKNDKELTKALEEFKEAKLTYDTVADKIRAGGGSESLTTDEESVKIEFETVRQMAKMTVGRRGNQFPIFTREFYHCTETGTGTRENVIETLRWIEERDPACFHRIHKNVANRIVPYVLLVPTYGDRGFCWEPFDRYNRVTSRGRIIVPMYPKDLKIAVLTAVADLRWQVAKEKASYYWMEEGLTGQYYQYCEKMKIKGDIKEFFIEDYILWMTKESEGVQRLEKEIRGIFWRNMPFPKERKEELRKRSLVYNELCQKDANREMSDGY